MAGGGILYPHSTDKFTTRCVEVDTWGQEKRKSLALLHVLLLMLIVLMFY